MGEEILEVTIEMDNGSTEDLKIQECTEWEGIVEGTRALLSLVNGNQFLVTIQDADYGGVSFKVDGSKHSLHYEETVIQSIFTEVK